MGSVAFEKYQDPIRIDFGTPAKTVREKTDIDPFGSHYDPTFGVLWLYLKPGGPAKFTETMLTAFRQRQFDIEAEVRQEMAGGHEPRIKYQVYSSRLPGIFSLGGDLDLFQEKIRNKDREGLRRYARTCVDLVHATATNYGLPITTIALVQGTALGGGFEGALAHNVVIAERQAKMGLPEIMFNLFPGMGAYQLLSRRIPAAQAEKLILSGRTYSAEELYEMGIVDVLADEGKGEEAVWDYVRQTHGKSYGRHALRRAIQAVDPFDYDDAITVVDMWVEAAFGLSDADLKTMNMLVRAQQRVGY